MQGMRVCVCVRARACAEVYWDACVRACACAGALLNSGVVISSVALVHSCWARPGSLLLFGGILWRFTSFRSRIASDGARCARRFRQSTTCTCAAMCLRTLRLRGHTHGPLRLRCHACACTLALAPLHRTRHTHTHTHTHTHMTTSRDQEAARRLRATRHDLSRSVVVIKRVTRAEHQTKQT